MFFCDYIPIIEAVYNILLGMSPPHPKLHFSSLIGYISKMYRSDPKLTGSVSKLTQDYSTTDDCVDEHKAVATEKRNHKMGVSYHRGKSLSLLMDLNLWALFSRKPISQNKPTTNDTEQYGK